MEVPFLYYSYKFCGPNLCTKTGNLKENFVKNCYRQFCSVGQTVQTALHCRQQLKSENSHEKLKEIQVISV